MAAAFLVSGNDRLIFTSTIYGEARGESDEGKAGVGWVIRNRAQTVLDNGKPRMFGTGTLSSACLFPYQFSSWNLNSPEIGLMQSLTLDSANTDAAFADCLAVADQIIAGMLDDPTQGSLYYFDDSISFPAAWGPVVPCTITIGRLNFYNHLAQ